MNVLINSCWWDWMVSWRVFIVSFPVFLVEMFWRQPRHWSTDLQQQDSATLTVQVAGALCICVVLWIRVLSWIIWCLGAWGYFLWCFLFLVGLHLVSIRSDLRAEVKPDAAPALRSAGLSFPPGRSRDEGSSIPGFMWLRQSPPHSPHWHWWFSGLNGNSAAQGWL